MARIAGDTEETDGARLAGGPWLRAGMPLALISYLRMGGAYTSVVYPFKEPEICTVSRAAVVRFGRWGIEATDLFHSISAKTGAVWLAGFAGKTKPAAVGL